MDKTAPLYKKQVIYAIEQLFEKAQRDYAGWMCISGPKMTINGTRYEVKSIDAPDKGIISVTGIPSYAFRIEDVTIDINSRLSTIEKIFTEVFKQFYKEELLCESDGTYLNEWKSSEAALKYLTDEYLMYYSEDEAAL